jgi:hypothetical protein
MEVIIIPLLFVAMAGVFFKGQLKKVNSIKILLLGIECTILGAVFYIGGPFNFHVGIYGASMYLMTTGFFVSLLGFLIGNNQS